MPTAQWLTGSTVMPPALIPPYQIPAFTPFISIRISTRSWAAWSLNISPTLGRFDPHGRPAALKRIGRSLSRPTRKDSCRFHPRWRSEEHTSELQSHSDLVCRLLLEKKKNANHSLN